MVRKTSDIGVIDITSEVFTNIVGEAAAGCFGVKGMASRKEGAWTLLRKESMAKGVKVHYEGDALAVELHIVVDRGVNMSALSDSIINEVSYKVSGTTGVPVSRVDVYIDSMVMD